MATKPTKRMAFNFLRSYFDVLNKIEDDKQKLDFLLSIINKQFLDEEPKGLDFLVDLCYESQRHQIEKSVNGWKTANKTDLKGNPIPPHTPPYTLPKGSPPILPPKEEEEEVKEQEKEKHKTLQGYKDLDFKGKMDYFLKALGQPTSSIWRENVMRMNKIKQGQLGLVVELFTMHLAAQSNGIYNKPFEEFRTHCANWIRTEVDRGRLDNYRTVKKIGSL